MNFCMGAFREIIGEMRNERILGNDCDKFLNRMCLVLIGYFLIVFFHLFHQLLGTIIVINSNSVT